MFTSSYTEVLFPSGTTSTGHQPAWQPLQGTPGLRLWTSVGFPTITQIANIFIVARKGQGTALVKASIIAFPVSLTSLLQGQKMERRRCGKTEQLFTLPVRSYQIAFLSCQQNKLIPNRTSNNTLSGRQAHFISRKENKAAATRPNNILHFAPKYHCSSSGLKVSFITLLQAEKRIFQRSIPKLSIQVSKHLDLL